MKRRNRNPIALAGFTLIVTHFFLLADDPSTEPDAAHLPAGITNETFTALTTLSPFRRTLALSDSIILTGIAQIDGETVATLYDTKSSETHLVSDQSNSLGWHLVGVRGDEADLNSLTAKIQIGGGEIVSIRYEKVTQKSPRRSSSSSGRSSLSADQIREAKQSAINYKKGTDSDGYRDKPPPEILSKLSKMSVQQRETINRQMKELRNKGLGSTERRKIYEQKVNQAASRR